LGKDDSIRTDGDTVMLLLRVIAESLGYRVIWSDENKTVELQNAERTMATMTIGSKLYGKLKMAVQLAYPPEIVNGRRWFL
jgi:hypothetical protein